MSIAAIDLAPKGGDFIIFSIHHQDHRTEPPAAAVNGLPAAARRHAKRILRTS